MINEDSADYYKFTGPQRLDKSMHTLEGIVRGISIDRKVNDTELRMLTDWLSTHLEFANLHPFNEVIPRLREILKDGIIDEEERADVLWLCQKFTTDDTFYCHATSDMQRLQGILGGIVADGVITKEELAGLQTWIDAHEHLRSCWPYDELESLTLSVLRDGRIDEREHLALLRFFAEFTELGDHRAMTLQDEEEPTLITGVCAVCPEIIFAERRFCFTGRSERYNRKALAEEVTRRGGLFERQLTTQTHYLIIGGDGNRCWAYACYGRKVEKAIRYRKQGGNVLLVHEYDLWDALEDSS